jgi:uncharacterized protein YndB with AHSA1/START domain
VGLPAVPSAPMPVDPIRRSVTVPAPPERAFSVFTGGIAAWWPPEYTWAQDVLDTIAIEPRDGGRCFERGPHGFECDFGRVLAWEPPRRLRFRWQIAPDRTPQPDPAKAGEVEVRFSPEGPSGTRVELEHSGFDRHGEAGAAYRDGMDSPEGWPFLLERYGAAVTA